MNTGVLARYYEQLTPRERVPLVMAAHQRGDEREYERLISSARPVCSQEPDYQLFASALDELSKYHLFEQLRLAVTYWRIMHLFAMIPERVRPLPRQPGYPLELPPMVSYLFLVGTDGWDQFCQEIHVDSQLLLRHLPGYFMVLDMERSARLMAYTPEEAAKEHERIVGRQSEAAARGEHVEDPGPFVTAADRAVSFHQLLEKIIDVRSGRAA